MITRGELKSRAKAQLGGKIFGQTWMTALLVLLIYSAIIGGLSMILSGVGVLLSGPLLAGSALFFLKQNRSNDGSVTDLFHWFSKDLGGTFLLGLLENVFIFLWSLLFIIPGFVKAYSYSLAYYIKNDNPEYGWNDCLKASMELTRGHKWELFVLDLSFIGWYLVGCLCLGLGTFWVAPYHQATISQFYEELKGQTVKVEM